MGDKGAGDPRDVQRCKDVKKNIYTCTIKNGIKNCGTVFRVWMF